MKRPTFVWIFTILFASGLFVSAVMLTLNITVVVFELVQRSEYYQPELTYWNYLIPIHATVLIIDAVFVIYFSKLLRSAKKWIHISFGVTVGYIILYYSSRYYWNVVEGWYTRGIAITGSIAIAVTLCLWWVVYDYIRNKKVDDKFLFDN